MSSVRYQDVAIAFATALVLGDFQRAREMLGPPLSDYVSAADLKKRFEAMYSGYAPGKPERVWFDEQFSGEEWPTKKAGDVGWAYVGVEGDGFVEAVTVTVARQEDRLFVREVEWGRP